MVSTMSHRVKRWRGGRMILRWTVTAVADAASRFRRVIGARDGMAKLLRSLAAHDVNAIEPRLKVALSANVIETVGTSGIRLEGETGNRFNDPS